MVECTNPSNCCAETCAASGRGARIALKPRPCTQCGAIALVFAFMLVLIVGFLGMSLDLGLIYNRQTELRGIANVAALAAARQLNGTANGVSNALVQAASAVSALRYQYNRDTVSWNDSALSFSTSAYGDWLDAGAAQASPGGLIFVRVDTSRLNISPGIVDLFFMRVLSDALASADVSARAVAGRSTINVSPLAVCALSNVAATARANPGAPAYTELVEYGFRRGVGYDLMQLNPDGTSAENFIIDPFDPPGTMGTASNLDPLRVGPYACTGQLPMPRIMGAPITLGRPFPLAALYQHLNSRFDQYVGGFCSVTSAPPDTNIKSFIYSSGINWMSTVPGMQAAMSSTLSGKLWTVADPNPAVAPNAAAYGPLWAYARAVPYSSYVPGSAEPAGGYTPFATSAWGTLYKPGVPVANGAYPSGISTPYRANSGSNLVSPPAAHKGRSNRRVLNVPLLACPASAGSVTTGTVLGIGKFMMTVPATATTLYAEFGGLLSEPALGGMVELYP